MFTQSSRQARIQRGFYRIASVLGQSLSRAATLEAIAQAAAEALGGSSEAVMVPSSGRLEAVGAYGLPADLREILAERAWGNQSPLFRAAVEGRILASSAIGDDERLLPDLRDAAAANRYHSLISVPVDAPRDAGRGLVLIFFMEERSFSDDDLELARHLADATRGALERSELFEAERGARALAQQLTRTGRLLTSELDPAALLAVAASTSAALSNAELYQRVALERERSVAILANIAEGIVAVDRDGKVVLWNSAAEVITGVPASVVLGRAPVDVLQRSLEAPDDGARGERLVPIPRGREEVWLSVTEAVMRDPLGAVAGRIFAFRDISGDRLLEQVKSDFVSTVSHELRTPLTSIYGFAETLLRQDVMFGQAARQTFLRHIP